MQCIENHSHISHISHIGKILIDLWLSDQRNPGSSPGCTQSLYLHMFTSAARLVYQRPSDVWITCDPST
jgi:hypothetical protein